MAIAHPAEVDTGISQAPRLLSSSFRRSASGFFLTFTNMAWSLRKSRYLFSDVFKRKMLS